MQDSLLLQLIDVLIDNKGVDLSKSELIRESGLSKATFFKFWLVLEKNELVIKTRHLGRVQMFMLNSSNPIVEKLLELESFLISRSLDLNEKSYWPVYKTTRNKIFPQNA
jgi:predicted transcriptional regulator